MSNDGLERRRRPRHKRAQPDRIQISLRDRLGRPRIIGARLTDIGEGGLGIETTLPLDPGTLVSVEGSLGNGSHPIELRGDARVVFCVSRPHGGYRAGLSLSEPSGFCAASEDAARDESIDYYEVLQLSPNADAETIHRVYRMLAQRFHPDNADSGNEEMFKLLSEAYRTLSDPERRAAYDARHSAQRRVRWKIFDQSSAFEGIEGEKRKRQGILGLLYFKRLRDPHQPSLSILEIEDLLGCPRDHLECSFWYLKENGWVVRGDSGRYVITAKGFDQVEAMGAAAWTTDRLLTTGSIPDPEPATASV